MPAASSSQRGLLLASLILLPCTVNGLPGGRALLQQQAQQPAGPAPDLAAFRRAGCDNFTLHKWQPLRPGYHITVPYGWMNDPHGMFERRNRTHLFFQYNPRALRWGAPLWGHVASDDLARWTWLPPALLPDADYDFNGVWSGAATVDEAGAPTLTYTAAGTHAPELGNYLQRQAAAVPADPDDPWLKKWVKPSWNPFLSQVPPGGTSFQFRDPTEARHGVWLALTSPRNPRPLPRAHFALAVGSQAFCMGGAGIYTAPSMKGPWSFAGTLFSQLDLEPSVDGRCSAAHASGPAFGGPCDQFGAACRMWEVVDVAQIEPPPPPPPQGGGGAAAGGGGGIGEKHGVYFLKFDDQSRHRGLFSLEWYVLSDEIDYSAVNPGLQAPPAAAASPAAAAAAPPLGAATSGYPNWTAAPGAAGDPGLRDVTPAPYFGGGGSSSSSSKASGTGSGGGSSQAASKNNSAAAAADPFFNRIEGAGVSATRSLFRAALGGRRFAPQRTDYGAVYASMVFRDARGRQVMWSWVLETAVGCLDSCSDQTPPVIERQGFKGVQTLPRVLTLDRRTRSLRAFPVPELANLRGRQLFPQGAAPAGAQQQQQQHVQLLGGAGAAAALVPVSKVAGGASSTARQLEVRANFTLLPPGADGNEAAAAATPGQQQQKQQQQQSSQARPATRWPVQKPDEFAVGVRLELGGGAHTDVYLRGAVAPDDADAAPAYRVTALTVVVDRARAGGGATNTTLLEGGPVPLPATDDDDGAAVLPLTLPDDALSLDVWVDHGVIEVFALGGLARVTSRIYPPAADDGVAWGVSAWAVPPEPVPPAAAAARVRNATTTATAPAGGGGGGIGRRSRQPPPTIATMVWCWWCRVWSRECDDARCYGRSSSQASGGGGGGGGATTEERSRSSSSSSLAPAVAPGAWDVQAAVKVWEVKNAWNPPAC